MADTVLMFLREKLAKLLSSDDVKAIQKILISLGHICMKETSTSHLDIALDLIFSLCRSKVSRVIYIFISCLFIFFLVTKETSISLVKPLIYCNCIVSFRGYSTTTLKCCSIENNENLFLFCIILFVKSYLLRAVYYSSTSEYL